MVGHGLFYTHTRIHPSTHIYTCSYVYAPVHIVSTCPHVSAPAHTCTYLPTCICTYPHTYAPAHTCIYLLARVTVHVAQVTSSRHADTYGSIFAQSRAVRALAYL